MLQLRIGAGRLIGSLTAGILLVCSYVLVWGGMMAENRYGAMAVAVGVPLYFVSLTTARRIGLRWLVLGIIFLGALEGLLLIVSTTVAALDRTGDLPFLGYALSVLIVSLIAYLALVRSRQ
jgi:hypothetical protein